MLRKTKQNKNTEIRLYLSQNVYTDWPIQHEFREFLEQDVHDGGLSEKEQGSARVRDKTLE